jgi:hypothetical protein
MPETSLQELKPRVVHCKKEPFDVYIGRPSPWGNPFTIGLHGNRATVISRYRLWLLSKPDLVKDAKKYLKGKTLGCWCSPKACHGDILLEIANEEECPKNLFNL